MGARFIAAAAASLIMGLAACVSIPPSESMSRADAQFACYWLSNEGAGWVHRPDLDTERACFEMDSCDGGLGHSGGGCYMWTRDLNGPRQPWSRQASKPAGDTH
ncbi:MAG: hypothetical protein AB7P07_13490 [Hyphomonadaceae bacterium]